MAWPTIVATRGEDGKISTRVYRKPSNTNITLKPQSCQHPKTIVATFKGELCRAYRLCSSPDQTKKEIEFLLNLFEDNGHDRRMLERIATDYTPPSTTTSTTAANKSKRQKNKRSQQTQENPSNLFDILPFREVDLSEEDEFKPYIVMPYLPDGKYHQMKRACDKAGVSLITKPGPKLKDVLCSANKTRHEPSQKPGVYELRCPLERLSFKPDRFLLRTSTCVFLSYIIQYMLNLSS